MLFFTGFPGFLGTELIRDLLPKLPNQRVICLVQQKFLELAETQRKLLPSEIQNRVEFVEGDLTLPHLGLAPEFLAVTAPKIEQIFHLAAVYDLNVSEALAMKVNVQGTLNTLELAKHCPNLKRFQYVSTCYVSGRTKGVFWETDLSKNQRFNNFYESTKYLAEVEVQKAMHEGLPCTIYRPGIVVGNSRTGETQKFDGPYFVLQWLLRQPAKFAILPTVFAKDCPTDECTLDLVPSDFVIKAISYLSQHADTKNQVFQLADTTPLRVTEIIQEFERVLHKKIIKIPTPLWLARFTLRYIPGLEKWMGVPYSALNYFVQPTHYDVSHTLKYLHGSGIVIPHFRVYLPHLVSYMKAHRNIRSKALT
jgi:thioester reductase-like protein